MHRVFIVFFFVAVLSACTVLGSERDVLEESIVMKDGSVRIEYAKSDKKVAEWVTSICTKRIPEISDELGLETISPIRIIMVPDMREYSNRNGNTLPEWGVAFAFMQDQMMLVDVKRAVSSWNALEKTIPHELSHLFLSQRVGGVAMPLWFIEGLAQWQAHQWTLLDNWHLMNAVWSRKAPTLTSISGEFPAASEIAKNAYLVAYTAFIEFFDGDMEKLPIFLEELVKTQDFMEATQNIRGEGLVEYSFRFSKELDRKFHSPLLIFQTGPLFTLLAVVFLFIVVTARIRSRRRLKKLEMAEKGLSSSGY